MSNPTHVQYASRRSGKTQQVIDKILEEAERNGVWLEVVYPKTDVTDEMVEKAARVFYESQTGDDRLATSYYRAEWESLARRALEAALS